MVRVLPGPPHGQFRAQRDAQALPQAALHVAVPAGRVGHQVPGDPAVVRDGLVHHHGARVEQVPQRRW